MYMGELSRVITDIGKGQRPGLGGDVAGKRLLGELLIKILIRILEVGCVWGYCCAGRQIMCLFLK